MEGKNRLLFYHVIDKQIKFDDETTIYVHLKFLTTENMFESEKNILQKEQNNIFQYSIGTIEHSNKPECGEKLKIQDLKTPIK